VSRWRWVDAEVVYAVHDRQLAEHGGGEGIRDRAAIESGLARPRKLAADGEPEAAALAAAYAFGLCRNHGFVDGNKRTAWVVARLFLVDNDRPLAYDRADAVRVVEALAAGRIDEAALAQWFRERLTN
jgi:death-on-curing protein